MRRSAPNRTRVTALFLFLWTLLFLAIIEATVSHTQDPAVALVENHKHKLKNSNHHEQHRDYSKTTKKNHHATKKLHPNSRIKSTFFRNGKIYVAGRPDWYNQYRQHRGPHNIMRKLTLESSHRRKATLTFPLAGGPSGGLDSAADDERGNEPRAENKTAEDQAGAKDKAVEPDDDSGGGDGKEDDMSEDDHEDEEGGRGSQSIQTVKKPQFVGVPTPVSVRHTGIIPKESRCGRLQEHGRWQAWTVAVVVGVVLACVN